MSLINDALKRARQGQAKTPPESPADPPLQPVENPEPERKNSVIVVAGAVVLLLAGSWFLWQWLNPPPPVPVQAAAAKPPATNQADAAKSSIASNLTKPFQAVAKLDAAIQQARQTEAATPAPTQPTASSSTPVPAPAPNTTSAPTAPTRAAPPPTSPASPDIAAPAKSAEAVASANDRKTPTRDESAPTQPPANEPPAQPISRNVTFPPLKLGGIYFRMSKPSVLINNRTLFLGDTVDGARVVAIERHSVKLEFKGATNEFFLR